MARTVPVRQPLAAGLRDAITAAVRAAEKAGDPTVRMRHGEGGDEGDGEWEEGDRGEGDEEEKPDLHDFGTYVADNED